MVVSDCLSGNLAFDTTVSNCVLNLALLIRGALGFPGPELFVGPHFTDRRFLGFVGDLVGRLAPDARERLQQCRDDVDRHDKEQQQGTLPAHCAVPAGERAQPFELVGETGAFAESALEFRLLFVQSRLHRRELLTSLLELAPLLYLCRAELAFGFFSEQLYAQRSHFGERGGCRVRVLLSDLLVRCAARFRLKPPVALGERAVLGARLQRATTWRAVSTALSSWAI